mgnify:CR=1 FL=1
MSLSKFRDRTFMLVYLSVFYSGHRVYSPLIFFLLYHPDISSIIDDISCWISLSGNSNRRPQSFLKAYILRNKARDNCVLTVHRERLELLERRSLFVIISVLILSTTEGLALVPPSIIRLLRSSFIRSPKRASLNALRCLRMRLLIRTSILDQRISFPSIRGGWELRRNEALLTVVVGHYLRVAWDARVELLVFSFVPLLITEHVRCWW